MWRGISLSVFFSLLVISSTTPLGLDAFNYTHRLLKKKKYQNLEKKCSKIPDSHQRYLEDLKILYGNTKIDQTCASQHLECGWSSRQEQEMNNDLPLFVFVTGIEGTGHHLWSALLNGVLDCHWV